MRTTIKQLTGMIQLLNKTAARYGVDQRYELYCAYGRYTLHWRMKKGGAIDVSPSLPAGEMWDWIRAYIKGMDAVADHKAKRYDF